MTRKIVVAVDGSDHSLKAIQWGIRNFVNAHDQVDFVSVGIIDTDWTDFVEASYGDLLKKNKLTRYSCYNGTDWRASQHCWSCENGKFIKKV